MKAKCIITYGSSPVSVIWIGMRSTGHTSTLPCCSTQTRTWPQAVKRPSKPSPVPRRSYLEGDSSHLWLYAIVSVVCVEVMKKVWAIHKIFLYNAQIYYDIQMRYHIHFKDHHGTYTVIDLTDPDFCIYYCRLGLKLNFCELYNVSCSLHVNQQFLVSMNKGALSDWVSTDSHSQVCLGLPLWLPIRSTLQLWPSWVIMILLYCSKWDQLGIQESHRAAPPGPGSEEAFKAITSAEEELLRR